MLIVDGAPVQIGSRAFEVLLKLVERRGSMVTKEELLDAAWPGVVVEENNISVQVATLRRVLGASVIVTVARRGYQLRAEPLPVQDLPTHPLTTAQPELLGREHDVAVMMGNLADAPLATIVGPGGVGKTALARYCFARHCALRQVSGFWIDLAPIRAASEVLPSIAKSLGIEMTGAVEDASGLLLALAQTTAFVALDNCEHQIEAVSSLVGSAVAAAPRVQWLTTSREALRVSGERVHRLQPLSVPSGEVTAAQAVEHGAIALLCKRVAESDRRFSLDERNVNEAVKLCQQLDGLPLAIEMAAARVATFGLEDVCRRLGQRLKLLNGGDAGRLSRHQTLKATYDWSYELLSGAERVVFRRLSPFLGGFRVDLAQRVACDEQELGGIDSWTAFDAIGSLVGKSLVQRDADDPGRFFLLESARDYAQLHLEASGEATTLLHRHSKAVAEWFAPVQSDADIMTDAQWVRRYSPERHNARAALAWACEQQVADDAAQLVTALSMLDWLLCRQAEVLLCGVPLELLAKASPSKRAAAYLEFGWAHYCDGNHAMGARLSEEAHQIFVELGDSAQAYRALAQLTRLHESRPGMSEAARMTWQRLQQSDDTGLSTRNRIFCTVSAGLANRPDYTIERLRELGLLAQEAGFESAAAICGCNLTDRLLMAQRFEEAVHTADHLLSTVGARPRAMAFILHNKAAALVSMGRYEEAYDAALLAFQIMPAVGHFLITTFALGAAREGRLSDAAVLHGCGCRIRDVNHEALDAWEAAATAETAERLRSGLGASQYEELQKLGAAMTAGEVLAIKAFPRVQRLLATAASREIAPDRVSSVGTH